MLNNNINNYLPWIEKYRPQTISDIISHDQNIKTIKQLLSHNALPHLLFYGSPGTGKTSTIMTLAKEIYGNNMRLMVMKLDASDDRGINSVREDIKGFAEKTNMFITGVRLIILDEADSMTFDAQFALRRIIEKYSALIRFCLICNYENKIIPAIRSRCANFRFSNLDSKHIKIKLEQIILCEELICKSDVIDTIAYLAKGDLRKAINLLQTIAMQTNNVEAKLCYDIIGVPTKDEINKILNILLDSQYDFNNTHSYIFNIISNNGYSLSNIIKELLQLIINNPEILSNTYHIIPELADLENMAAKSTFNDIYISCLIGIFKKYIKN